MGIGGGVTVANFFQTPAGVVVNLDHVTAVDRNRAGRVTLHLVGGVAVVVDEGGEEALGAAVRADVSRIPTP